MRLWRYQSRSSDRPVRNVSITDRRLALRMTFTDGVATISSRWNSAMAEVDVDYGRMRTPVELDWDRLAGLA